MSFTSKYLTGQLEAFYFKAPESSAMSVIVVIPCFNEPDLGTTILSLAVCDNPGEEVGIVVVVNSPVQASVADLDQNRKTLSELDELKGKLPGWLHLFWIDAANLPEKWAGAGLARKIGFDWAVSHFHQHDYQDGLLISMDADTLVAKNYLKAVIGHFRQSDKTVALTVYFEHPVEGQEFDQTVYDAMILYEIYLRYYKYALQSTGFPHALYTLGSAFAVRANAYISMGGMNRRKAGEDFYFLHKMVQYGRVDELNCTTVYPSARLSARVPFGTGPALLKYVNGERDLLLTYPLQLFQQLIPLFELVPAIYEAKGLTDSLVAGLPGYLPAFLKESGLDDEMKQLAGNCGTSLVFKKRFFYLFDAFQVLKWLNFNLNQGVAKQSLLGEAELLLQNLGFSPDKIPQYPKLMLNLFRELDHCKR